jgi:hypothetical protein
MPDLISILVLTYAVSGHILESEISLAHGQCLAAEKAITRSLLTKAGPLVELLSGDTVPVLDATCLAACPADGEPLVLLRDAA